MVKVAVTMESSQGDHKQSHMSMIMKQDNPPGLIESHINIINDSDQAMRSHLYGHVMPCDLIDHPLVHAILDLGRELVKMTINK